SGSSRLHRLSPTLGTGHSGQPIFRWSSRIRRSGKQFWAYRPSDPDIAAGRSEACRDDARRSVRRDPGTVDPAERIDGGLAEPIRSPVGTACDFPGREMNSGFGQLRAVCGRSSLPWDAARKLWVGLRSLSSDLAPPKIESVGSPAVTGHRVPADPSFYRFHVVDGYHPAEPSAAGFGAGTYRLAEGNLIGRGMIEHFDDLQVLMVLQREDHISSAEARMRSAVDKADT